MNPKKLLYATWIGLPILVTGNTAVVAAEVEAALTHVDISRCVDLATSTDRLACYDAAAAKARGTVSPTVRGMVSPTVKSTPPKPSRKHVLPARAGDDDAATFGKGASAPAQVIKDSEGQQELHATVAALKVAPQGGAWIITLSNGQVWRQIVPEPFNLKEGYTVRIYPSRWGSAYRLSAQQIHGFIQVERVDSRE